MLISPFFHMPFFNFLFEDHFYKELAEPAFSKSSVPGREHPGAKAHPKSGIDKRPVLYDKFFLQWRCKDR